MGSATDAAGSDSAILNATKSVGKPQRREKIVTGREVRENSGPDKLLDLSPKSPLDKRKRERERDGDVDGGVP